MPGPAPDAGRPTETIKLACGHRVTNRPVTHPLVVPGSSIRCPVCTVPRRILQVVSLPAASGRPNCAHGEPTAPHKILIFDDADGF